MVMLVVVVQGGGGSDVTCRLEEKAMLSCPNFKMAMSPC